MRVRSFTDSIKPNPAHFAEGKLIGRTRQKGPADHPAPSGGKSV